MDTSIPFQNNTKQFGSPLCHAHINDMTYIEHCHYVHEMVVVLEGSVKLCTEDDEYHAHKDDVIFIPSGMAHCFYSSSGAVTTLFGCTPDFVGTFAQCYNENPNISCMFRLTDDPILQMIHAQTMPTTQWMISMVNLLLCRVSEVLPGKHPGHGVVHLPTELKTVMGYISSKLPETVSQSEAAQVAGISTYQLSRLFNTCLGIGFPGYQAYMLVNAARRMLTQTDFSVCRIAQICGFSSLRNFNRSFQQYVQLTPNQYRLKTQLNGYVNYYSLPILRLLEGRYGSLEE